MGAVVEAICTQYEEPTKLTEVELHREELKKAKKGIAKVGSPALSLRIEQSLGRLAQREQELERAQQEKNSRELLSAKIKSVNVHGRLSQLQEGVNALRKMNNLPPDLILERDAQLRRVEQEIESIQQKVKDTAVQLPTLTNRNALRSHRDALVKIQPRCEGTELAPVISQQLAQADTLLRFFDQLEREQTPQTKSLVENREQYLRLDQLAQEYIEHLSPVQNKLIEKLKAAIDNGVRVQQQKARDWLAERERQFQQGRELVRLDDQLVSPPAYWFFLSESGQQPLQVLRQQVRRKIDEDALMAIERQFRQIRDRQLRQECLAKLHQILEEEAL